MLSVQTYTLRSLFTYYTSLHNNHSVFTGSGPEQSTNGAIVSGRGAD